MNIITISAFLLFLLSALKVCYEMFLGVQILQTVLSIAWLTFFPCNLLLVRKIGRQGIFRHFMPITSVAEALAASHSCGVISLYGLLFHNIPSRENVDAKMFCCV